MKITPRRIAAAAAVLVALLLAGTAQAAAPYEPNDTPESAFGPIGTAGGLHVIDAALETAQDEDWFSFFVPDGTQDVAIGLDQPTAADGLCLRVQVEDDEGVSDLASIATDGADPAGQIDDTIEGPARAFVSVDACGGSAATPTRYRLALQGDWPGVDPRPADDSAAPERPAVKPAGSGSAGVRVRQRCHVAAVELRTAANRLASARRADHRRRTRASAHRVAAARKARTRAIAKVVRVC